MRKARTLTGLTMSSVSNEEETSSWRVPFIWLGGAPGMAEVIDVLLAIPTAGDPIPAKWAHFPARLLGGLNVLLLIPKETWWASYLCESFMFLPYHASAVLYR